MSRFGVFVTCLMLLAVPVLSACGSDSKSKEASPAEIARVNTLAKANNVCLTANSVTDPVQPKTAAQVATAIQTLSPAASAELQALRSLTVPADLRDNWNRMLELMQGQITLYGQIKAASDQGASKAQLNGLIKLLNDATQEAQQRAVAVGLPNCGT